MSKNFLVSCIGQYGGSGSGTGSFLLVNTNNESNIIDLIDTTGLYFFNDLVFRVIRKLKLLVIYNEHGIKSTIYLPELTAVHDILIDEMDIYCVCTGKNQILVYDHFGKKKSEINFPGQGDAWHINCLRKVNGELYCSAFGIFDEHRKWTLVDHSKTGMIYNVNKREKVVSDLHAPHNPLFLDGKWMVCNSLDFSLMVCENGGTRRIDCGGFTRGLTYDENFIYVGVSAHRKSAQKKADSSIRVLHRGTFETKEIISVPFPEVYDLLLISDTWAQNIRQHPHLFALDKLVWQTELTNITSQPKRLSLSQRVTRKLRRIFS